MTLRYRLAPEMASGPTYANQNLRELMTDSTPVVAGVVDGVVAMVVLSNGRSRWGLLRPYGCAVCPGGGAMDFSGAGASAGGGTAGIGLATITCAVLVSHSRDGGGPA